MSIWVDVAEELPADGEFVEIRFVGAGATTMACRGHYQSTGAWFDEKTHTPIYDRVTHWKVRSHSDPLLMTDALNPATRLTVQ
jgi:Protein of unknown function (DUF551)